MKTLFCTRWTLQTYDCNHPYLRVNLLGNYIGDDFVKNITVHVLILNCFRIGFEERTMCFIPDIRR